MAEDRIDLLRQAARSMLAALQMLDVDDNELHDLTLHVGYIEKPNSTYQLFSNVYAAPITNRAIILIIAQ
ncbi:hypothetical protein OIDMADRAFT_48841 [Oidiodendron maius Zn]|uniref:Uncharacterized protein n=1 Tax=Oidiodendron maius (strain Zn) TaxID=913774 RepID=A0A0C3I1Q8_OIDMZ|nr:hypothetical protein OIDMADRAFT_48841 [Oidiodendron maius Zn]